MNAAHGVIASQTSKSGEAYRRDGTGMFRFAERLADHSGIVALFAEYHFHLRFISQRGSACGTHRSTRAYVDANMRGFVNVLKDQDN